MNGSKVLITGGLGNLGSWLTDYLLQNTDWEIYVLSSKPNYYELSRPYHLLTVDITDKAALESCLAIHRFDYVYHLASFNDTFVPGYDQMAHRINVEGTQHIVQCLSGHDIKKFVYLSTFHVYGTHQGVIDENTPCNPLHSYGRTHLDAEEIVAAHFGADNHAIYRLSNSYGCPLLPNNNKWYLVLNDLCKQAVEHKKIKLLSNGKPTRDFIWMGDVCSILHKSLQEASICGVFNLNSGLIYSMLQVATIVQRAYHGQYGIEVMVEINPEDEKEYKEDWHLSNQKLVNTLPFEFHNQIASEAQKIFKLLEKNKTVFLR